MFHFRINISNRSALTTCFIAYLCIIIAGEKFDIFLGLAILLDLQLMQFMHDLSAFCFLFFALFGLGIHFYYMVHRKMKNIYHSKLLLAGLLSLLVPVVIMYTWHDQLWLKYSQGLYLFIPDLVFFAAFFLLIKRILIKEKELPDIVV